MEVRIEAEGCADIPELVRAHLSWMVGRSYAVATISSRRTHLGQFATWSAETGITEAAHVNTRVLEAYERWLVGLRRRDGSLLSVATRVSKLIAIRALGAWAVASGRLPVNPFLVALPRAPRRLPRAVLTAAEVERVIAQPDCAKLGGLRDRAILEVLYSTGIRRAEVVTLDEADLDTERGTLFIRAGKGDRDRVVPIGSRAIGWIRLYRVALLTTRGTRGLGVDVRPLFLNSRWRRIRPNKLTERLRTYIVAAGIAKPGSVHIFRHTMATLMHDGGADIRDLQEILGHAELSTTQIYTHVSIGRLKQVHARTHPAEQIGGKT